MLNFKHVLFDFDNILANNVSYDYGDDFVEVV